jgi:AhpD family alkylhydroperoxidase
MRLEPIEKPRSPIMRIAYWMSRRQLGKVMTPLKVIYARNPKLALLAHRTNRVVEKGLALDPELALLIETQSSAMNHCGFCHDLHLAQALRAKLGLEKFGDILDPGASPAFSERERAALAYTGAITSRREVSDAVFETLRKHFGEREIVEITWLNALSNFYNLMAVPLGLESDGFASLAEARAR